MRKRILFGLTIAMTLLFSITAHAETPKNYEVTVRDVKTDASGNYALEYEKELTIDGATYSFDKVEYTEKTERETRVLSSAKTLITEAEPELPGETVVEGVKFILTGRTTEKEAEENRVVHLTDEKERNATVEPTAEKTVEQELTDEATGETYIATLTLSESVHQRTEWVSDLTIPVRFDGYNEPVILFMGELIVKNETTPLPKAKYQLFLQYAELSQSVVRITDVKWTGSAAKDGRSTYRNATAYAETLHDVYTDKYETDYKLPDLTYVTYSYEYTEADESYYERKTADAKITYTLTGKSFARTIGDFLETPLGIATVAIVVLVIAGVIALVIILHNVRRKKKA